MIDFSTKCKLFLALNQVVVDIANCRWLYGMLSAHSIQASIFMDFSSYVENGDYAIKVAVECEAQLNIPSSCDNLGCIPRAVGMAIAIKKRTPYLAPVSPLVIIIVTIESLMQNLMEL